eukprot:TRINITY_DN3326_c0_g1_i2.p2 TRINITY_DN3326_c0_g1~~TRINITY_DN3326_c0_g1_i2.p2  ORF type:complete len:618 (-),score=206.92 TRINITY_DN3326_c0_g1_i2:1622-3475(-)
MDPDADRVTYTRQNLGVNQPAGGDGGGAGEFAGANRIRARRQFREFIRGFRQGHLYPYRDQLLARYRKREHWLEVDMGDIGEYSAALQALLQQAPGENLANFEKAAREVLQQLVVDRSERDALPEVQIVLRSAQEPTGLRQITADRMSQLLKVPGIVISASRVRSKAVLVRIRCQRCKTMKWVDVAGPFAGIAMPAACDQGGAAPQEGEPAANCGPFPYVVMPDESSYVDQQTLKLQESPEVVPTGEMPRHILVTVDRSLVDRASPGTRVSIMGVASLFASGSAKKQVGAAAIRTPFMRAVGVEIESEGAGRAALTFTPAEEEEFLRLSRRRDIYQDMADSVAPSISGDYTVDIKKAIACQLFSGSRKTLPDGTRLRGDINVLLLGDPSTAKSQFLKFVERVAPVGVYTSGKGSSAAGLTASVVKDSRGEFYLEGGALVLADGGVVCIDEFDKMRENDRVAIHEAMEQQTISVAKAGITTILNSRTSVLAAANPIFGRYDDLKSAAENIDLMTTILSRFDLIFVVRDIRDEERDRSIARHVMGVHINASAATAQAQAGERCCCRCMPFICCMPFFCCIPRLAERCICSLSMKDMHSLHRRRPVSAAAAAAAAGAACP